jgi:hypothetical protein
MRELAAFFPVGTPSHTTIQSWALKLGVGHLDGGATRRDDWIYILDATMEFGSKKCLLILGIPLSRLRGMPATRLSPSHADVTVLRLEIKDKLNGTVVKDALIATASSVGCPVQVVSDHGPDIRKGIEDFCAMQPRPPVRLYDITHKAAAIVRRKMENDTRWKKFQGQCGKSKKLTVQTDIAHLGPPAMQTKARWLNVDRCVEWADALLAHGSDATKFPPGTPQADRFEKYFGWIRNYSAELAHWRGMMIVLNTAKTLVKANGFQKGCAAEFIKEIAKVEESGRVVPADIMAEMKDFLAGQESLLSDDGIWLGCSDIIESVFGKYKSQSGRNAMKGLGKSVLGIPVFTGEKKTMETMVLGVEKVTCRAVQTWLENNIGVSFSSKRRKALGKPVKAKNTVKFQKENEAKMANF